MSNPIFSFGRLTYVPFGSDPIEANFVPFEHEDRVLSIKVSLAENDIPVIKIKLDNIDLRMMEHPIVVNHTTIGVRLFRDDKSSPRFTGYVNRVKGGWELDIEIVDLVFRASFKPSKEEDRPIKTTDRSRKDIVTDLVKRLGFSESQIEIGEVSDEKKSDDAGGGGDFLDDSKSIWTHLADLADKERAQIIVIGRESFFFGKRKFDGVPKHIFKVEPGSDDQETEVLDWDVDKDLFGKTGEIEVFGLNLILKEFLCEKGNGDETPRDVLGQTTEVYPPDSEGKPAKTTGERTEDVDETTKVRLLANRTALTWKVPKKTGTKRVKRSAGQSKKQIKDEADSDFREEGEEFIRLTLKLRFTPDIFPGEILEMPNIGKDFSGLYYVTNVGHTLETSAETNVTAIRNASSDVVGTSIKVSAGEAAKPNKQEPEDPKKLKRKTVRLGAVGEGTVTVQTR